MNSTTFKQAGNASLCGIYGTYSLEEHCFAICICIGRFFFCIKKFSFSLMLQTKDNYHLQMFLLGYQKYGNPFINTLTKLKLF